MIFGIAMCSNQRCDLASLCHAVLSWFKERTYVNRFASPKFDSKGSGLYPWGCTREFGGSRGSSSRGLLGV